jgi:predicted homoserine dehydrogenase-like protein
MIIVDRALRARAESKNPIRVGLVGAGFMGRAIANQIINSAPGLRLAAIANRTPELARRAYREAGIDEFSEVESASDLEDSIARGRPAVVPDGHLVARAGNLDVIVEVTGAVNYAAGVVLDAIQHGKHVVLMDAELHGTVGCILKVYADRAGVIFTDSDGDQPGVQMNLYRYVVGMGMRPLVIGNIKGLQDPYRTPTTQKAFAERWGQKPEMVSSFADGTKMSFEQAVVANAVGFRVPQRGMFGWDHRQHVDALTRRYDYEQLERWGGIVDYVVGAVPSPGVYIMAAQDDPKHRRYLNLYKLGEGPLYSFYHPYHLCHFELPFSVARAVDFGDPVLSPMGAPFVEVVATAKRDLRAGETLDYMGGYMTYGQCESAAVQRSERLLPMAQAERCTLLRDVSKDTVITYADVELPAGRVVDRLRAEQDAHFAPRRRADEPVLATSGAEEDAGNRKRENEREFRGSGMQPNASR